MIHRNGDQVTLVMSMPEYQSLLVAMGYATGSALATKNDDLLALFKQLLATITEIKP